jgi:hypothetical protein
MLVLTAGMLMETWLIPHYLSPFTAAFYALGLQAMRHLRVWSPNGQPVGLTLVRSLIALCVVLAGFRTFAGPLHLRLDSWPTWSWYGSKDFGGARATVQAALERMPGKQLAIVRYSSSHDSVDEWVFNAANLDDSRVIWAREMQPADDQQLVEYYKDRNVWLIQPDNQPPEISPYVALKRENAALR